MPEEPMNTHSKNTHTARCTPVTDMPTPLLAWTSRLTQADQAVTERWFDGWVSIYQPNRKAHTTYPNQQTPIVWCRSTAKLIQALPIIECGLHHHVTDEMLAIACASHAGSPEHQALVHQWLSQFGLKQNQLACGTHPPIDTTTRHHLIQSATSYNETHHNCSGQHAALLAVCKTNNWPLNGYTNPDHPLQQAILTHLTKLLNISATNIAIGIDGCHMPTYGLPLDEICRLLSQWGTSPLAQPLINAIANTPIPFGGKQRADSMIVKASGGNVLAKVGAEGLIGLLHRPSNTGIAIKIACGDEEARNQFTVDLLSQWGWLPRNNTDLSPWQHNPITCGNGSPVGKWHYAKLPSPITI